MDGVYEDIEEYNRNKKRKILIAFDDMIADILSNKKKHNPTVTELFIRGRKSNISLVYITQSSFALAKKNVKFCTLFYDEHSEKTRASTKRI